ncbi:MAG: diaminopimelate decarboxylase [Clostridiales bacterium]|nr:diaminopimelate decarboxylase [Clostridiales bacterium]
MESYINNIDFFRGNDPEALVAQYGTPLYVYNESVLRSQMKKVEGLIKKYPYTANYSIKSNSNLSILKIALEEGLNADAMSVNEMRILLLAGFPAERIFFVPNNVSAEELTFAHDNNIMTSLDSIDQLRKFGELFPGSRCAVRINPGVGAGHHEKVVTAGKKTKFAIAEEDIDELLEVASKYDLKIVGINQHVGSLYMVTDPFIAAIKNFLRIARRFEGLEFIDFGGGFGTPYHKLSGEEKFDIDKLSQEMEVILDEFVADYGYAPLFKSEPGRYCVAESSVILGRVHATKSNYGHKYAGTDIGMNVLARPTLYDSWHDIEILRGGKVVSAKEGTEVVTVTGNICESGDILAKDRELPIIKTDDLVAVLDAGAYGYSMSSSYNLRPKSAEILIKDDGEVKLIRRRETFEDLISLFC